MITEQALHQATYFRGIPILPSNVCAHCGKVDDPGENGNSLVARFANRMEAQRAKSKAAFRIKKQNERLDHATYRS